MQRASAHMCGGGAPAGQFVAGSDMFELVWICASKREGRACGVREREKMPHRVCVCMWRMRIRDQERQEGALCWGCRALLFYIIGGLGVGASAHSSRALEPVTK